MEIFLAVSVGIRSLLAALCGGVAILRYIQATHERSMGGIVMASAGAWGAIAAYMVWHTIATVELWYWETGLFQTFGVVVWLPAVIAVGAYFVYLLRAEIRRRRGK